MTKTPSNNKSQSYNINANEDIVIFLTSKLITCFIDTFTSGMKSQSIASYKVKVQTYIGFGPWRWNAIDMGFVAKRPSKMQGQWFFQSRVGRAEVLGSVQKILISFLELPLPVATSPEKLVGWGLTSPIIQTPFLVVPPVLFSAV